MMRALSKWSLAPALLALTLPVIAAAAPAPKASAGSAPAVGGAAGDVRCLMTMFVLSQNKTQPQAAQTGQAGVIFFSGRLSARAPGADLGPMMKAQAPTLTGAQLQTELQRCGPLMQAAQQSLQAGFSSLRPAGAPGPAAPPAPPPTGAPPITPIPGPK